MTPKFNAIKVAELEYQNSSLTCKAAFVDTTTGRTHGWTTGLSWSPAVMDKVKELKELMEQELSALHFNEADGPVVKQMSGLGELLSGNDSGADSV